MANIDYQGESDIPLQVVSSHPSQMKSHDVDNHQGKQGTCTVA